MLKIEELLRQNLESERFASNFVVKTQKKISRGCYCLELWASIFMFKRIHDNRICIKLA